MLELRNVSKRVGAELHIRDVSLKLEPGSLNVLLGPTLSGKTSLMRLMAGLDRPTSGSVLVDGKDVTGVPVQKRNVAMVYQQFINYPTLSVYENIASPLRLSGASKSEIDAEVKKAAKLMQLTEFLDRTPLSLSGGQQQRTALARAVVKNASLVLLDEPLANLDYKLREELREELPKIFAESGTVFVYATTEPSEALLLGGNTATLSKGRITQFAPTVEVFRHPVDITTAQTFSDPPMNTIRVEKAQNIFHLGEANQLVVPKGFWALPDGAYTIGFRAHHLMMDRPEETTRNEPLEATVTITEITGSESFVHVKCAGQDWVLIARGVHNYDPGDAIKLYIDTRHLLVFDAEGTTIQSATEQQAA